MATQYSATELEHHLKYEIEMLNGSYELITSIQTLLVAKATTDQRNHARWAMMEAFCIHARLLIEFFIAGNRPNSAKSISNGAYKPPKKPEEWVKLNNQIAHLMDHRTMSDGDKLNGPDRSNLFKWIDNEMRKFKGLLVTPYDSKGLLVTPYDSMCIPDVALHLIATSIYVDVNQTLSTTNAITIIT